MATFLRQRRSKGYLSRKLQNQLNSEGTERMILHAVLLLAASYLSDASVGCDPAAVPSSIEVEMGQLYRGWAPVTLSDLGEYEKKLWSENHAQCPGVAVGHFVPFADRSYAFVLIKREGSAIFLTGLVFWLSPDHKVHSKTFVPPRKATNVCVVWRLREKGSSEQDEIVYEAIEVGSSAYVWKHGEFIQRTLSY